MNLGAGSYVQYFYIRTTDKERAITVWKWKGSWSVGKQMFKVEKAVQKCSQ